MECRIAACVALGIAAPAWAGAPLLRVAPPPVVVPGLQRIVIAPGPTAEAALAADALAAAVRSQLGADGRDPQIPFGLAFHNGPLPRLDEGLAVGRVDFALAALSPVPTRLEVVAVGGALGGQLVVALAAEGRETAYATHAEARSWTETQADGTWVTREGTAACASRAVEATVTGVAYGAADGVELARVPIRVERSAEDCDEPGDDGLTLPSAADLVTDAVREAAHAFAFQLVPAWRVVDLDLPRDPATRKAAEAAGAGRFAQAVDDALLVLRDDSYNATAVNLVGVAFEAVGRYDEALALFRLAQRLRDDRVQRAAVDRVSRRQAELATLASAYGQVAKPAGDWPQASPLVARARSVGDVATLGVAAVIKGARGKRVPVFAAQDPTAAVVTMLPGGTAVRRVRTVGGLTEIQLPDGALGWVSSKEVK